MMTKLKVHLLILPRWFAAPFFGGVILLGAAIAGDLGSLNAWLGLLAGLFVMAGGHSFNSVLDYSWTKLDYGEVENRSAEKDYTGGQNLLAKGIVSPTEVSLNASGWYALSAIPMLYLAFTVGWGIVAIWGLSICITFWYSWAKFNWTHELALFVGTGPLAVLFGMFAVDPSPAWWYGLLASVPTGIILSFLGLPLDEYPDAEANLKKGVKSIAYMVWKYDVDLGFFTATWLIFVFLFQLFLIDIGILASQTWLTFVLVPFFMATVPFLKKSFRTAARVMVIIGALYPILMLVGQIIGG